jgi:hypothetical protein
MKTKIVMSFALTVGLLILCGSVSAHHGTNASYDISKQITKTGTVTQFVWSNPHCQIYFDVKDDAGNIVHWAGEIASTPYQAKKLGWTRDIMKPGDQITITGSPSRAGTPAMVVRKIVLSDGRVLGDGSLAVERQGGESQDLTPGK